MGLVTGLLNVVFGNERNIIKETAEVFRANAEEDAARDQQLRTEVLQQYTKEFNGKNEGFFNRIMDGVNRVPRPALALGTLALFVSAMVDPVWFAARMQGIALVPEPLWWLLGVIVSFYFGARHQVKSQQFQSSIARTIAATPQVVRNLGALKSLSAASPGVADAGSDARLGVIATQPSENQALTEWHKAQAKPATK